MNNLFNILPEDFFKPLTSKYRREYADCIMLIFNTFKAEISYGVSREVVIRALTEYFESDDIEMTFSDDETPVSDAREKANGVVAMLKNCGWIEYEQETDHQLNVVLFEYAVPVIESMNALIRNEETEYQGLISQIHSSLQNSELYSRPYELIIKGVKENTDRLISELKKLNASIKRHMEKQTNDMEASEVLDLFFEYHQNIGSKAYLRMKTSENISYFRTAIVRKLDEILEDGSIMERGTKGYMEIEQNDDQDEAYDALVNIILDIKSAFYSLDDIIEEIDRKHTRYQRNAVMRARFLLSAGNNTEGKLSRILSGLAEELNKNETSEFSPETAEELRSLFSLYPQNYISPESLKTMPVLKKTGQVDELGSDMVMSEESRALYREALRARNRRKFSRKNINEYVINLLGDRDEINVSEIPVQTKRDVIRIVYISIYAGNRANQYTIKRLNGRIQAGEFEIPEFIIYKR